jgi:hypothetical protein
LLIEREVYDLLVAGTCKDEAVSVLYSIVCGFTVHTNERLAFANSHFLEYE